MKNKIFYIISALVSFFVGVILTYLTMTKQQIDRALQAQITSQQQNNIKTIDDVEPVVITEKISRNQLLDSDKTDEVQSEIDNLNTQEDTVTLNDYSLKQANHLIADMPNVILEQYIDKFMANGTSKVLQDKRRFAERAIEEIYQKNDNQPLSGEVKLSYSDRIPEVSIDTNSVSSKAKIYAHLDTRGQVPKSPYVFVKWVNNTTGQVLLFEKKDIEINENQNWVSFTPDEDWEIGSYDIRFYQFTSELEPIAQISYQINQIMEVNPDTAIVRQTGSALLKHEYN